MRATETPPRFAHDVYSTCIDEIPSTAPASFAVSASIAVPHEFMAAIHYVDGV